MTNKEQPFKESSGQVERATHDPAEDVEHVREKDAVEREQRESSSEAAANDDRGGAAGADRAKARAKAEAKPITVHNER